MTYTYNQGRKLHMGTASSSFLPRFIFQVLAVVGLVCLLVVGSLGSGGGTRKPTTLSTWSAERLKHGQVIGRDHKPVSHAELDFNYMNKRRVPNGPDPIHNRRAGNSGRPPGLA